MHPPHNRSRSVTVKVVAESGMSTPVPGKTVIVKNAPGDLPFPWSEKDPYKLPVSIERVQKMLMAAGERGEKGAGCWGACNPCCMHGGCMVSGGIMASWRTGGVESYATMQCHASELCR